MKKSSTSDTATATLSDRAPAPAYRRGAYKKYGVAPPRRKVSISLAQSAIDQADAIAAHAACSRSRAIELAIELTAAMRVAQTVSATEGKKS